MPKAFYSESTNKTYLLLNKAEGGSDPHLARLALEWPANKKDSKRAVYILLGHLRRNIQAIDDINSGNPPRETILHSTRVARGALTGLDGYYCALSDKSRGSPQQRQEVEEMVSWIKPYLDDVLSWFEFFARHFIEISSGDVTSHGTSNSWLAVLCCQFLPPAMQYLTDEVDHLERIIDLAVTTWVKESTAALPAMASASPENYALHVNANFRPILECVQHEITRSIVVERLNALDSKTVKGLVNSLYRLCTTWRTVSQGVYDRAPATVDSMMITDHIRVALAFCDMVPAFNRAFLRSGFSGMAIKLAQDFRLVPSSHTPNTPGGSKEASIGVEIASYFLGLTIPKPYELPIIVPEIIEAGLLNIIIDDILHPLRATSSTPFETWTYGPLQQDPLRHLVNLCSDPRICKALFSAIEVLPDSIHHAIFAKPKYKKAWGLFLTSAKAHDLALNAWSTEAVALCDNSTHDTTKGSSPVTKTYECSWCQTKLYCSSECQRQDRLARHTSHVCSAQRVSRIEHRSKGLWISHRSRWYRLWFLGSYAGLNIPLIIQHSKNGYTPICVVQADTMPPKVELQTDRKVLADLEAHSDPTTRTVSAAANRARLGGRLTREGVSVIAICRAPLGTHHEVITIGHFWVPRLADGSLPTPCPMTVLTGTTVVRPKDTVPRVGGV